MYVLKNTTAKINVLDQCGCHVSGSVPPFYREVYEIVCPNQEQVDRDLFVELLVRSNLPKSVIMQVSHIICKTKQILYYMFLVALLFIVWYICALVNQVQVGVSTNKCVISLIMWP
jgi:hypothetical protein